MRLLHTFASKFGSVDIISSWLGKLPGAYLERIDVTPN